MARTRSDYTPTPEDEARVLAAARADVAKIEARGGHVSWGRLAKCHRVTEFWLRKRLDPGWYRRRSEQVAQRRKQSALAPSGSVLGYGSRLTDEELAERKALIPDDTRDLTGRIMGDPVPNDPRRVQTPRRPTYHPLSAIPTANRRRHTRGTPP